MTRAFIAVCLDEPTRAAVAAEIERLRPLSRAVAWVPSPNLHLTLKFLGDQSDARLAEALLGLEEVAADFDARRDARVRTYRYTIVTGRPAAPLLFGRSWHVYPPLAFDVLARLAEPIMGTHDFRAFRAADCDSESTKRDVFVSTWARDGSLEVGSGDVFVYYSKSQVPYFGTTGTASVSSSSFGGSTDCSQSSQGVTVDCSYSTGAMNGNFLFSAASESDATYDQSKVQFSSLPAVKMTIAVSQ